MTAPLPEPPAQRQAGILRPQPEDLKLIVRRLRFLVVALAIVIIAGFAVLGTQIWLMNARAIQLATKVNGIDTSFGKFEETNTKLDAVNTKLDAISQRLAAEFKTIGAEIAAQTSAVTKSIASLRGPAPSRPISLLPESVPGSKPAMAQARP